MKHATNRKSGTAILSSFGVDTAAVLFLLAFEYGRVVRIVSVDGILMAITMAMVLVLPYFLPSSWNAPAFGTWFMVRSGVVLAGLVFGAIFGYSLGVVLPQSLKFAPMMFLVLVSMISGYIQFYGLLRLRPAK